MRRNFALGEVLFVPSEYPDLRKFYQTMEANDQQSIVLRQRAPGPATANGAESGPSRNASSKLADGSVAR